MPARMRLSAYARSLIARSVALKAGTTVEIARPRGWIRRACRLLLTAAPIAGGSDAMGQDDGQISAVILTKLRDGHLPRTRPSQVWAARGNGVPCDACDRPMPSHAIAYEVQITSLDVYHFHSICFEIWSRERARYLP